MSAAWHAYSRANAAFLAHPTAEGGDAVVATFAAWLESYLTDRDRHDTARLMMNVRDRVEALLPDQDERAA